MAGFWNDLKDKLGVALDVAEDGGLLGCVPNLASPDECVYVLRAGKVLDMLTARLPHRMVTFRRMAKKYIRPVFHGPAVLTALRFLWERDEQFSRNIRVLGTVPRKHYSPCQ